MSLDLKSKVTQALVLNILSALITMLKTLLPSKDIKDVMDVVLNKLESRYEEGSFKDNLAESAAGLVRETLAIPDSDPDN